MKWLLKKTGNMGEDEAAAFLVKKGYGILERNYRTPAGEIDIIAFKKGVTVFVEVKKRSSSAFGAGFEAVDARKRSRIIKAAGIYLSLTGGERACRFDVVSIDGPVINHIENAFGL